MSFIFASQQIMLIWHWLWHNPPPALTFILLGKVSRGKTVFYAIPYHMLIFLPKRVNNSYKYKENQLANSQSSLLLLLLLLEVWLELEFIKIPDLEWQGRKYKSERWISFYPHNLHLKVLQVYPILVFYICSFSYSSSAKYCYEVIMLSWCSRNILCTD